MLHALIPTRINGISDIWTLELLKKERINLIFIFRSSLLSVRIEKEKVKFIFLELEDHKCKDLEICI